MELRGEVREAREAVAGYPYDVPAEERGEAFDELVARFDAVELVIAVALEKSAGLLPFLEAAQSSRTLSEPPARGADAAGAGAPLLWFEAEEHYENDFTTSIYESLAGGGADGAPRGGAAVPRLEVVEEPPFGLSEERFGELAARFREAGGVVCPLSSSRMLAFDLLLARLLGVGVLGVAPLPLAPALGPSGTLPELMVVAQTLSAVVVPKSVNATFWTMAAHAEIVDAERLGGDALHAAMLRALEAPSRPARKTTPRKGASLESALTRAGAAGLGGWKSLTFPPLVAPGAAGGSGGSAASAASPASPVEPTAAELRATIATLEATLSEARSRLARLEDEDVEHPGVFPA